MKKILLVVSLAAIIPFAGFAETVRADKIPAAVFALEPRAGVTSEVSEYITEIFRTALFETGSFTLVERAQMEKVVSEQKLSLSGLAGSSYAVKLGELVSARKIMLGSVGKVDGRFYAAIRSIDVESGKVDNSATVEANSSADLAAAVKGVAMRFAGIGKNDIFNFLKLPAGSLIRFDIPENFGGDVDSSMKYFSDELQNKLSFLNSAISNAIGTQSAFSSSGASFVTPSSSSVSSASAPLFSAASVSSMGLDAQHSVPIRPDGEVVGSRFSGGVTFGPYARYCIMPAAFGTNQVQALAAGFDFTWHVNAVLGIGAGVFSVLPMGRSDLLPAVYAGPAVNLHWTGFRVVTFELDLLTALCVSSGNSEMPSFALSPSLSVLFQAADFAYFGLTGGVLYGPASSYGATALFSPTAGLIFRFAFGD